MLSSVELRTERKSSPEWKDLFTLTLDRILAVPRYPKPYPCFIIRHFRASHAPTTYIVYMLHVMHGLPESMDTMDIHTELDIYDTRRTMIPIS